MQVDVPVLVEFPRQTGPIRRVEAPCLTSGFGTDSLSFPKKSTIFFGGGG